MSGKVVTGSTVQHSTALIIGVNGAVEPMQIDADPQEDQQNAPDSNYVVENPTLDLEQYASNYSGLMRIERLQFIADHCPQLRVEALKMALSFVQRTFNVDVYEEVHRKLTGATRDVQGVPDAVPEGGIEPPPLDTAWAESTRKKALLKLEKLDTDLKNYKGNSIKESIRRGHDDLGDHYLDCGDLSNALKCYSRARDYCTSAKHVINMCLNVIKVSVYLQNWSHVLSYVSKAESTPEIAEQRGERDSQNQAVLTKLKCAAGLAELASRKYKQAAKCFLLASFDHCDFPELLSPSNVAVYGGMCALATFDRQELQKNVISSSSFKLFLELEPQVRDIIFKFYESKYASCLKMLDEMKDNLLLDMYLAPHVRTLYTQIRNRALIQYFSPYVSADMHMMATAFNTTVVALEDELTQLILEGLINARIDSHSKSGRFFMLHVVSCFVVTEENPMFQPVYCQLEYNSTNEGLCQLRSPAHVETCVWWLVAILAQVEVGHLVIALEGKRCVNRGLEEKRLANQGGVTEGTNRGCS
ncbi:CSN1 protein, partial [Polyodon spathula]|nr:CSN1 protein [Polyodon spathula]